MGTLIESVVAFVSTNIDNTFILMLLYSQVNEKFKKVHIVVGQYVGLGILVAISIFAAFGLNFMPQKYIGLLGLVPMYLGIKEWVDYKKGSANEAADDVQDEAIGPDAIELSERQGALSGVKAAIANLISPELFSSVAIAVASGGDNIGVYVPIFARYSGVQFVITIVVFAIMMGLWCWLGSGITNYPKVTAMIQKHQHIAVPVVFIGLGIYIFIENGLFGSI